MRVNAVIMCRIPAILRTSFPLRRAGPLLRRAGRIAGVGLLGLLLARPAGAADDPEAYMQRAQKAFDQSDLVSAMSWYRKAAELDYAPAQARLAYLLDKSEQNEEAASWYQKAAAQGYAEAIYELAHLHAIGEGVPQDNAKALEGYTQAAQSGYMPAMRVLAIAYEKGELGLRPSYARAIDWLNEGVTRGDYWSIKRLARAYRTGQLGLKIDRQRADALEKSLPAADKTSPATD
jgi:TPR repeat protein